FCLVIESFCPFRATGSHTTYPGRCPGLGASALSGRVGDAANALGNITEDGVKFIIAKLQKKGLLKRVGGRKYGEWLVFI
ncbi:hypothetical protein ACTQ3Y_16125, partial [Segatella copri]